MEALDVLACSSTVTTTRSIGTSSFFAAAAMIRRLAWCGMSQAMSAGVTPPPAIVSEAIMLRVPTARRNTSLPFMRM